MSSVKRVSDELIDDVVLNQPIFWLFRLDVLPFVVYYAVFFSLAAGWVSQAWQVIYAGLIALPIGFALHLLLFLLAQGSVAVRCRLGYNRVSDIKHAKYLHVKAAKNAGKDRLVLLQANNHFSTPKDVHIMDRSYAITRERLEFQKVVYNYDAAQRNSFVRLEYPESGTLRGFLLWRGHASGNSVGLSLMRWGLNEFDIPIPNFLDLYLDHLVAPFFVFQVLCLFLWSLDDYWYYSAFTLLMLMFFEGLMCKQRQQSLLMLRNMRRPPVAIFAFREQRWVQVSSDGLVPGDLISLTADAHHHHRRQLAKNAGRPVSEQEQGEQESVVPCDALLVRGSCVVNEAMLTGESVPQMKESIRARATTPAAATAGAGAGTAGSGEAAAGADMGAVPVELGAESSVQGGWRRHMLYSGTSLVMHHQRAEADGDSAQLLRALHASPSVGGQTSTGKGKGRGSDTPVGLAADIPPAPDGGCVAVVVRTGFGTSQGGLMRKILFATERVTGGNSSETFYFIGVLVVFALVAAVTVLHFGLGDEKRNKFRLVLHCIMIITSVVPPELPMELSLAVTNSLAALGKSLVYCTEPFRISFAGRLDVVCFDKTGTLTKDQMLLRGVVAAQELPLRPAPSARARATASGGAGMGGDGEDSPDAVDSLLLEGMGEGGMRAELGLNEHGAQEVVMEAGGSPDVVLAMMGACHDLMPAPPSLPPQPALRSSPRGATAASAAAPELIGDPLEVATMSQSGFTFQSGGSGSGGGSGGTGAIVVCNPERGLAVRVRQKYPFTSELKRMSVLVEVSSAAAPSVAPSSSSATKTVSLVFSKGAPEVMAQHLACVPDFYHATYHYHMCKGRRVLAMACKPLSAQQQASTDSGAKLPRSEVESGLQFVCFLVFDCDLKVDSKSVVRELKAAAHRVVMITGDSVYTAADVARRLGMLKTATATTGSSSAPPAKKKAPPSALILHPVSAGPGGGEKQQLVWRRLGEKYRSELVRDAEDQDFGDFGDEAATRVQHLAEQHSLCVTGPALLLLQTQLGKQDQKDQQADTLCQKRYATTLRALCPHVTIFARVSPTQKEAILLALNEAGLYTCMCGDGTNDVGALKAAHVGVSIVNDPDFERRIEGIKDGGGGGDAAGGGGKKAKGASARDRTARAVAELQEQEQDPTIVKLGDASIASPFTARRTSIDSVLTVIRQGRCTLVTTIQVYKVLALNCLISAYMMSALYLRGLKQGDMQMTASGLVLAALFFFLSQAKPLLNIAPQKPTASVFAPAVWLSLLGQFAVHFCSLLAVLHICEQHLAADDFSLSPDGKFQPNVVNSAVFLLSALMQVNNFVVNYRGHPFTQSISENTMLWRSVQVLYAVLLVVAGGQLEPLNDLLQMAPFPSSQFQAALLAILVCNFGAAYAVECFCKRLE